MFDYFIGLLQSFLTFCYNISASIGFPNYGLAIILMTVAFKAALYPLTVKQVKSMKGMQEIQPKMKELQEKYKNNPEKLQKEMTLLYQQAGVNPLAGCLPLLVQMPILIGMFYAIQGYKYVGDHDFLWIADLSQHGDPYYILPILAGFTTYLVSKQTTTETTQQAKMMLYFMPLFIAYITNTFPAGLGLYWVVSNVIQIIQQWWMYRRQSDVAKGEAS